MGDGSAAAVLTGLIDALSAFQVAPSADDIAVLALRSSPPVLDAATPRRPRGEAIISTGGRGE